MKRVLITGMSGTGKSTVTRALAERGYKAIDTDYGLSEWVPVSEASHMYSTAQQEWMWLEDRIQEVLSAEDTDVLFISGCTRNQTKFYSQFDHVVLLTAPADVIVERLATRTTNAYGRNPEELSHILQLMHTVEPHLRRAASLEVDTRIPVNDVVTVILDAVLPAESARYGQ